MNENLKRLILFFILLVVFVSAVVTVLYQPLFPDMTFFELFLRNVIRTIVYYSIVSVVILVILVILVKLSKRDGFAIFEKIDREFRD